MTPLQNAPHLADLVSPLAAHAIDPVATNLATPLAPPQAVGHRASILRFDELGEAIFLTDGLLVLQSGRVLAVGDYAALRPNWPQLDVTHWRGKIIAPGFVDMHVHYPQLDVIGSRADGLLNWLSEHTFPHEARFSDPAHAGQVAEFFLDEMLRNGVTTASVFCTSHPCSVDAFFKAAEQRNLRMVAGKCLQDRHCPDGVRDQTEQSLRDTEQLIARWHGRGRLGYAITPRFAPSCSEAQLRGAGELAASNPSVWIQSHVSENVDEVAWAQRLFPNSSSYLGIYDDFGLLRERSIYAHCIHFSNDDRALMHELGAAAAVCPTSNQFLGSGNFDFHAAQGGHQNIEADLGSNREGVSGKRQAAILHGLASDVGGGMSFSPFVTMRSAYVAARSDALSGGRAKTGLSLLATRLWWLHTAGAAQAMGLQGVCGNLAPGCDADFVVLNPQATPLLARKTAQADALEDMLFSFIMLADDRAVSHCEIAASAVAAISQPKIQS